ncbi:MAG: methyl-accepting chemotaxis protein [Methylocystis sp.]|uniref:methyl-accepting chemotaxis protein n=1 Tax=Methylocystis sp. TaxID=1911079 RepID=UPI003DA40F99
MKSFFAPATALISRFNYPGKFILIGLVFAIPIGFMLTQILTTINHEIRMAETERDGLEYIVSLRKVVEHVQQHRGMANGYLGGDLSFAPKLEASEAEINKALAAAAAQQKLHGASFNVDAEFGELQKKWQQLDGWKGMTPAASFGGHTAVVNDLMALMVTVADKSGLTLDPAADSYYLKTLLVTNLLPLEETLAQTRGMGTLVAARKTIELEERVKLSMRSGTLQSLLRETESNLKRGFDANPALREALQQVGDETLQEIRKVDAMVNRELILAEQITLAPAENFAATTKALAASLTLYDAVAAKFDSLLQQRAVEAHRHRLLIVGLTLLLLAVGAYLFVGTYISMHGAISDLRAITARFAAGDLTGRVKLKVQDELVHVAESFNGMADQLGQLIENVAQAVRKMSHSAADLSVASEQVAKGSQEQSNAAASMAAAVEEVTVSIAQVADNSRHADEVAGAARTLSADGLEVVQAAVSEMRKIAQSVQESAVTVGSLGDSSTQISEVLGEIKSIADQTNLLALNAAIEAARAGETGRGFAVVADEVRKLAERTTQATIQIGEMVDKIRAETTAAVAGMESGRVQVNTGVELANRAGAAMERINQGAQDVTLTVSEIAFATREQSSASNEIARNVERIAQMAEENAAAVNMSADAARQLKMEAERLEQELRRFKL